MTTVGQVRTKRELEYIKEKLMLLNIDFATPSHAETDFRSKNIKMYALRKDGTPIAICSVVRDNDFHYNALKRMVILDAENRGKGYAKHITTAIVRKQDGDCGCTPWATNVCCQKMLASLGFEYQYTFNEIWTFWKIKKNNA